MPTVAQWNDDCRDNLKAGRTTSVCARHAHKAGAVCNNTSLLSAVLSVVGLAGVSVRDEDLDRDRNNGEVY